MLSNAISLKRRSSDFKELLFKSISKISCSVGESRGNQHFIGNKGLYFNERYMSLMLSCRVKQMQSNATRLKRTSWVYQEFSSIISKITCSVGGRHEIWGFFEIKKLFFNQSYMFLISTCRVKRTLSNASWLKRLSWVFKELSLIIAKISCP